MRLSEKQRLFAKTLNQFQSWMLKNGYEYTLGDAYRDPRVFGKFGERKGYGQAGSLHKMRLAQDINLFINDQYIYDGDHPDYQKIGEKWESMNELCAWGGRFSDSNHFSFKHGTYA